jgi:hypothetical protein
MKISIELDIKDIIRITFALMDQKRDFQKYSFSPIYPEIIRNEYWKISQELTPLLRRFKKIIRNHK